MSEARVQSNLQRYCEMGVNRCSDVISIVHGIAWYRSARLATLLHTLQSLICTTIPDETGSARRSDLQTDRHTTFPINSLGTCASALPSLNTKAIGMSNRVEAKHTASKYDFVKVDPSLHCKSPGWLQHAAIVQLGPCRSRSGLEKG